MMVIMHDCLLTPLTTFCAQSGILVVANTSGGSRGGSQGAMDPPFWLDQVLMIGEMEPSSLAGEQR